MIYVSYATKNTPYMQVLEQRLLPTLIRWNLNYDIEYPLDKGNWQKNTHIKAEFLKRMLLKHKQPIVFLDADATIERFPILFESLGDYDISYHSFDWFKFWRGIEGNPKREYLSGTLYLNYNAKVLEFLDTWIDLNKRSTTWEQRNMQQILEKWGNKLKVYPLPIEYIAIVKRDGKVPSFIKEPIIVHWQASRRLRK